MDLADVVYSMSRDQNDVLELSVYNPNAFSVCVSYSDWPGGDEGEGNVLRVTGVDGTEWTYTGLEIDTVGRAKDMRIPPHSDATVHVNIRKTTNRSAPTIGSVKCTTVHGSYGADAWFEDGASQGGF